MRRRDIERRLDKVEAVVPPPKPRPRTDEEVAAMIQRVVFRRLEQLALKFPEHDPGTWDEFRKRWPLERIRHRMEQLKIHKEE